MKQRRRSSLIESIVNVIAGVGVATATQIIVFPWFGLYVSLADTGEIAAIFTAVSIVRQFCLRRLFEHLRVEWSPAMTLATGSARAPIADRGNDLYETPEVATEALLRVENLPPVSGSLPVALALSLGCYAGMATPSSPQISSTTIPPTKKHPDGISFLSGTCRSASKRS